MIPSYPTCALIHALTYFPIRCATDDADLHPWPLHYSLPYKHRAVSALQHPALQALYQHGPTLASHLDALPPGALLMRPPASAHHGSARMGQARVPKGSRVHKGAAPCGSSPLHAGLAAVLAAPEPFQTFQKLAPAHLLLSL